MISILTVGSDTDAPPSYEPPPPPTSSENNGSSSSSQKDQTDNGSQPSDNLLKSNLRDSPKTGSSGTRGPPSPKNHLHVKFQLEKERGTNTGLDSGYPENSGGVFSKEESKAIRQLNFEEPVEKSQPRRYTVLERLEKKLIAPEKKEFSEFKQQAGTNSKVSARVKQIESQSAQRSPSNERQRDCDPHEKNLLDRPSTPSGNSPRIQEGLIKKLEPKKEKSRLGEFKLAAKIHKRKVSSDGPTPLKAKGRDASSSIRMEESSFLSAGKSPSNEGKSLSRENSGEFQLKRPASRTSSSESLNGSGSGSRTALEKLLDSRSSSAENISDDKVNFEGRRQRNTSGGSTDRNSTFETLTDGDTGEDPLSCGLKRRSNRNGSGRRTESGSETDEYSPTSTKDNVINIKERSPSPATGFVRKGSYRRKRTTSGGSEENDSFRDILPDKHELVTNRRKMSEQSREMEKNTRSTNDSSVERSKGQRPWKRRTASDPCLENKTSSVGGRSGSQPDLSNKDSSGSHHVQSDKQSSKIPVKSKVGDASGQPEDHQSPFAMSRGVRGRQSERVKVAKKEVPRGKRSSSVGAARNGEKRDSLVVADKPPLAKAIGKTEKGDNKEAAVSQKSSRSASREELIRR